MHLVLQWYYCSYWLMRLVLQWYFLDMYFSVFLIVPLHVPMHNFQRGIAIYRNITLVTSYFWWCYTNLRRMLVQLFPEMRAIGHAHAGTHASTFTYALYCTREIIVFSLFVLLLYVSCKENIPKCGVHLAWKDILFELFGWMFKTAR